MSLQEPEKKMSKSDPNPKGYISMMDVNVIMGEDKERNNGQEVLLNIVKTI